MEFLTQLILDKLAGSNASNFKLIFLKFYYNMRVFVCANFPKVCKENFSKIFKQKLNNYVNSTCMMLDSHERDATLSRIFTNFPRVYLCPISGEHLSNLERIVY